MLPRDTLPLSQVARAGALLPVGDPRQQAFQKSLAAQLGQTLQAEVLRRLDDGSFVVRVADTAARMQLPQGVQSGQQLPLTLVALSPRPTFQFDTGKGPAFAEAGPAPAFLEGRDGAALVRSSAPLAQAYAQAPLPGGAAGDGAGASISPAGRLLGEVIAAAHKASTQAGAQDGAAAIQRTPLLAAPSGDASQLAGALQNGLEKSGLFYESHLAEWARGTRTLGDLALEPQARGMPAAPDPNTAQLINQQLSVQEQGRVAWQGQLWPGQDLQWEVERKDDDARAGGRQEDGAGAAWQSRLRLRFAGLGEINAEVVLSGQQLHIRLDAASPDARARMQAQQARLGAALDAAGTPLATLAIHGARAPGAQADPGPDGA